jgi:hypothetical protein
MLDRRDDDMAVQTRLSADLPYHPGPVASLADLSLDELRFLRSCYERWYELSPAEASAIIRAARKLIADLIQGGDDAADEIAELKAVAS